MNEERHQKGQLHYDLREKEKETQSFTGEGFEWTSLRIEESIQISISCDKFLLANMRFETEPPKKKTDDVNGDGVSFSRFRILPGHLHTRELRENESQ